MAWIEKYKSADTPEFFVRVGEQKNIVLLDDIPYEVALHFYRTKYGFGRAVCSGSSCSLCSKLGSSVSCLIFTIYDLTLENMPVKKLYIMKPATISVFIDCIKKSGINPEKLALSMFSIGRVSKNESSSGGHIIYLGTYKKQLQDTKVMDYKAIFKEKTANEIAQILSQIDVYKSKFSV